PAVPLSTPCSSPHASKPSHADWLNDLSSIPPVSVTIATEKSPESSDCSSVFSSFVCSASFSVSEFSPEPPQATRTRLRANNKTIDNKLFLFFISKSSILVRYLIKIQFPPLKPYLKYLHAQ